MMGNSQVAHRRWAPEAMNDSKNLRYGEGVLQSHGIQGCRPVASCGPREAARHGARTALSMLAPACPEQEIETR